jgi:hypothetical protein
MHDWFDVASDAFAVNFRIAEEGRGKTVRAPASVSRDPDSKDCQVRPAQRDHGANASNEGRS